jgi:phosphoglycolate phosphatase
MHVPRLVLWDVDHTLIENAGVSKEIYAAAFVALTGRQPHHLATTEGRTDPDIMADLLQSHAEVTQSWQYVEDALTVAGQARRVLLAERGHVLPGAVAALTALAAVPQIIQTIVTGNIRTNAEMKLNAFDLAKWFDLDVGGYGSDNRDRAQLVEIARARAGAKYGAGFADAANAVVIGDTPRDIEAAKLGSARVLAVASGIHGMDELLAAGSTYVIPSLTNTAAVLGFVLGTSDADSTGRAGTQQDAARHP